ncbi:MAG: ABC transporter substrate-binding protein [Actinomycetota bacterium]
MNSRRVSHLVGTWVIAIALVACTGSSDEVPASDGPSSSTDTSSGLSPTGGPRGSVTVGVLGEPMTLDPYAASASDLTYVLARPLYPSLFRSLPDGSTEPYLAESVDPIEGGIRVQLRAAQWSDGSPITSRDVVKSARRARSPSGFALADSVRAAGSVAVEFRGDGVGWETALAAGALVLPEGRPGSKFGGPYELTARTPGLQVVMRPNPRWFGGGVGVARVRVQFIENLNTMVHLLRERRLDVIVPPSAVNLGFRLEEAGFPFDSALGWESVSLDFSAGDLGRLDRLAFAAAVRRGALHAGFVRSDGRISDTLTPEPGMGGADGPWREPATDPTRLSGRTVALAAPTGDELLNSFQDVIQLQLDDVGAVADLIDRDGRTFYGRWDERGPADAYLVRSLGSPARTADEGRRPMAAMPMFQVATYLAWNEGVAGLEVQPTIEGPLWNLESWSVREP